MATVLVVDDSPVDRTLVSGLLKKCPNVVVEVAPDGEQALARMREKAPQLVVTDLMMPGMDGLQLVSEVVSNFPLVPVVLMTGQGSETIAVQALRAGAASYVPKSQLSDLLVETVENLLAMALEEQTGLKLMECMTSCSFVLPTDLTMITPLVNFLHRFIHHTRLCDETNGIRVCVALEEALNNAAYHGNLEIGSETRETDRAAYRRLVEERRHASPYKDRTISVNVSVSQQEGRFTIRDEGSGFDQSQLPDPTDPANLERPRGRGLLLMRTFMDEVNFNQVGNEVTMVKLRVSLPVPV